MPTLVNRVLRTPWGFPLVVAVALAGVAATETVHHRTTQGLTQSMRGDEVTQQSMVANYYALDRVNSIRAYLLQPQPVWISRYREANAQLEKSIAFIVLFLEQARGADPAAAAQLAALFAARSADLARAFEHAQAGRRDEALATLRDSDEAGRGVGLRSALLKAIELAQGERTLADGRVLAAVELVRWLMHALITAMVLAAYALLRQTQQIDAVRRRQAEQLTQEVAARTADLRELAGYLITTREDERARLARELHDEMGGLLSTIKLDLARLRRHRDLPTALQDATEAIDRRVSQVVELKRRVIENLRPSALDHLGLTQAIAMLCCENAQAMEVPTDEDLDPLELAPELELALYRVAQEALTNVRKYSRAQRVRVALKLQAGQVHLTVEDDGIGFDEAAIGHGHHGLAGMRLRVEAQQGQMAIGSGPGGRGTRIHAELPARPRAAVIPA